MDLPFKIFGEGFEQGALDQFYSAVHLDYTVKAALMPDAHQGYTLPIGAVVATDNMIMPSWVGYDIGCGMCAIPTTFDAGAVLNNADGIFNQIYENVPVGFKHNVNPCYPSWSLPTVTGPAADIFAAKGGYRQLGTLGGGNHFIEVGADEMGAVWIIIHSGSRGIGHGIASHYMRLASPTGKASEGHFGFEADSDNGQDYIQDMEYCLAFALENRLAIAHRTEIAIKSYVTGDGDFDRIINRNHNHAEHFKGMWIHRKGATHAEKGMLGVIPGNMRDGSYIVEGLGNPDALWSSSHGAGRVMSRMQARREVTLEAFQDSMDGIVARVEEGTRDESPFAYKDIRQVMAYQTDLVNIVAHVKPILNVKG